MNKYTQITLEERYIISHEEKQGKSFAAIARMLGRHRSTIAREFNRNCSPSHGYYYPDDADSRSRSRKSHSRRNQQFSAEDFAQVTTLIKKQWSPEQISNILSQDRVLAISHETIYRYIWRDKRNGGDLWVNLRGAQKRRRKRYRAYDSRGRLANKRNIADRPPSVKGRRYFGHWEIDTVMGRGSTDCIVTLVERKTGFSAIGKLKDCSTASLNKKTKMLIRRDTEAFKTITADNGTEFHQYQKIENSSDVKFYFANPHRSWERGSNENMNGLIRQYLPKGKSMENLSQADCDLIANKLNTRPRKRLGYKTPEEYYYAHR